MPYDEQLAMRLRGLLGSVDGISVKEMFGGLAFLDAGRMLVAVRGAGGMMVRVDPARADELLESPHASQVDMGRERRPKGWLSIEPAGYDTDADLERWLDEARTFMATLPPKG